MILQPLTRHPRRKTIIKVGLFVLKISFFLPFSLLAQTQAAAFTPALIAFSAASSVQTFSQYRADPGVVTNHIL